MAITKRWKGLRGWHCFLGFIVFVVVCLLSAAMITSVKMITLNLPEPYAFAVWILAWLTTAIAFVWLVDNIE